MSIYDNTFNKLCMINNYYTLVHFRPFIELNNSCGLPLWLLLESENYVNESNVIYMPSRRLRKMNLKY